MMHILINFIIFHFIIIFENTSIIIGMKYYKPDKDYSIYILSIYIYEFT